MKNVKNLSVLFILTLITSSIYSQGSRDLTGTTVNANAFRFEGDNHTTVRLSVNIVSPDLNYADGVRFDFGSSNTILDAFVETDMGIDPAVMIQGSEVMFGDSSNGIFNGDGIFLYDMSYDFVVHLDGQVAAPIDIEFIVYDDGWAQDYCINDNNCEQCNDYGWGVDCEGNYLTVALNAEGVFTIQNIEILAAPNQNPRITSLMDVNNDQGKQMMLSWVAGDLIDLPYFTEFSLYRYSPSPSDYVLTGQGVFYGEYFSSPGSGASPDFGELILTREDSLININFDQNPIPVVDDFQVRWTGDIFAPVSGLYNFRTHSDDGVRLFVNGNLVIDQWYDFPPTSHNGSIELSEGQHEIILEYYENGGGAMCELFWTVPGQNEFLVTPSGNDVMVSEQGTWDYLNTVPWIGHEPYAALINTIEDELATAFKVVAHTDDPNLNFHSDYITGRSYDNIAPPAPNGLFAVVENSMVSLSWNSVDVDDFNFYSIHRAPDSLFQSNFSNFVGYSVSPNYIDENPPHNVPMYYKVSATDMGGNLGLGSQSAYAYIAVNRPPQVFDVALSPAVPNDTDDITVSYTFSDPDGDAEQNTEINWFKNGVLTSYVGTVLPAAATSCSEEWYAEVRPGDGELQGDWIVSNVVTICGANTAPVWSDEIPMIHIAEDSEGNRVQMAGFVTDSEQAISQLILTVAGNTNDEVVSAYFQGSQLIVSTISENFYGMGIATLTLRANDGNVYSDAFVDVSIDPVNDNPVIISYNGSTDFNEDEGFFFEIYDFTISDPDNDIVDMTLNILPGDNYTRSMDIPEMINTPQNFNGAIDVHVEVVDDQGGADIYTVPLSVNPVNDPSFLVTSGSDIINNGSANEEEPYSLTLSWKDPDGSEDASVYEVSIGGPAENWLDVTNVYSSGPGIDIVYSAIISGTPDDVNLYENDISFTVVDRSEGDEESFTEYYYIPINAVNDEPVVVSYVGPNEIQEDQSFTASIYDFVVEDVDNDFPFDFTLQVEPGDGYSVSDDLKTITPIADYVGALDVGYSISDGLASVSFSIPITVLQVNDSPQITRYNGPGSIAEDSGITFSVSDFVISDPDGLDQTFSISVLDGDNYTLNSSGDGLVPDLNYNGTLLIGVVAKDQDGASSDIYQVELSVTAVNDLPTIRDLAINPAVPTIDNDLSVSFMAEDIDGDNVTASIVWYKNGTVETSQTNATVPASATLCDEEWYVVVTPNDGTGDGESYTSNSVVICGANTAPVWSWTEPVLLEEDGSIELDLYSKMYDAEHAPSQIVYSVITNTGSDQVSATITGQMITLTAIEQNFNGDAASDITVNAYDGGYDVPVTFSVNVTPVNDAPVATNDTFGVDEAGTYASGIDSGLLFNDVDVDGDDLQIIVLEEPMHGVLTVNTDQSISYVHDGSETISDMFIYAASDGELSSEIAEVQISITAVNDAPVIIYAASFETFEEVPFDILLTDFIVEDPDSELGSLTLEISDGDNYTSLAITDGYTVTPADNFSGQLSIAASISDGISSSDVVELIVNVIGGNDAPVVVTSAPDIAVDEDSEDIVINLLGTETAPYFYDSDGDSLNFNVYTIGAGAVQATLDGELLNLSFNPNMFGQDSVFVTATDPSGDDAMDTILVTVNFIDDTPEIVDAPSFEIMEDDSFDVFIYQFVIRDPDTQFESIILDISAADETDPIVNQYSINPIQYGFRIVPVENFFGDIPLIVTAYDGSTYSEPYSVSLHVVPINDAPEIITPMADIVADEDAEPFVVSLGGTDTEPYFVDVDGDSIQFDVMASNNDIFDFAIDGYDLHISPMLNMFGVDTLHIAGTDGSGSFVYDTVLVIINSVNDAPTSFSLVTPEDSAEVIITTESIAAGATIDVSWTPSMDADEDSVAYGFLLFNGPYSVETPALYTAEVGMTQLMIPHSSAIALLETAGFQSITCDWLVFATDGQDTTMSDEIRTLFLDARPVLTVDESVVPEVFALHQNFPNPFNPTTTINYDIPESQVVSIMIYDIMGRKVRSLVNEFQEVGYRSVRWDATDDFGIGVSAGMYVYTIQAGDFRQVRKMVLLK